MVFVLLLFFVGCSFNKKDILINEEKKSDEISSSSYVPKKVSLTITAVGDCTLGSDPNYGYANSFHKIYDEVSGNKEYFFKGVQEVIGNDDITIANLENTFTEATDRAIKSYNFKGPKEYAQILPAGSVEIVNLANNHTYDYKEVGFNDTISNLNEANIHYFGYDNYYIYEIKGLKIGFAGYYLRGNYSNYQDDVIKGINYLKENNVDLIIIEYHWGLEYYYEYNKSQADMGHFTIDNGADLVLGSRPHVVQGIEKYKDKYIVYSLGNFVFGGHRSPEDKDSFIYKQVFNFEDNNYIDTEMEIIPVRYSGPDKWNLFSPIILDGEEKNRVYNKILKLSKNIS